MCMCVYIYVCTSTYTFITQKLLVVEGHAPKPKRLGGGLALRQAVLEMRSLKGSDPLRAPLRAPLRVPLGTGLVAWFHPGIDCFGVQALGFLCMVCL